MPLITNAKLSSNDLCNQSAEATLLIAKRVQESISLSCIALFHADTNKSITVSDDSINLYAKRYVIQSFQMDITAKTAMTITGYLFSDSTDFDDRLSINSASASS